MKSIKEKAIEIYPTLEGDVSGTSENLVRRNGFQAGANYVLECIEESIKNSPAGYGLIYHIIEQLKKQPINSRVWI